MKLMTKKDYVLIADCIAHERGFYAEGVQEFSDKLIERLAHFLALDNPRFNKEKFIEACNRIVAV